MKKKRQRWREKKTNADEKKENDKDVEDIKHEEK